MVLVSLGRLNKTWTRRIACSTMAINICAILVLGHFRNIDDEVIKTDLKTINIVIS